MPTRTKVQVRFPRPHPAQAHILRDHARFNVLACGRRFGKTVLLLDRVTQPALGGLPVAWFAPNEKLFEDAWREAVKILRPVIQHKDQQKKRIELVTGGVLEFWTLHNTDDPGRSRKYARVVVDEAAMAPRLEKQWTEAIRATLADYRGSAWFASTPKGSNYFRDLFRRDDPDFRSWQFPTAANPHISPDEIEAARHELPSIVFAQEFLAEFVDMAGARVKREWLRHGTPPDTFDQIVMGVDLAISTREGSDYTAAVVLGKHEDRTWVLAAERTRAGFHDVVNFIRAMAERYNPTIIAIEQVQYQAAVVQELLRKTNLPVAGVRPDRDKLARFLPLEARYEQSLVWHAPGLLEFEDELLSFPEGAHDDLVDASAYAFNTLTRPSRADLTALRRAAGL